MNDSEFSTDVLMKAAEETLRLYGDILYEKRPVSGKHAPLTKEQKASVFLPFSPLAGFDESIAETQRMMQERFEPGEEGRELQDQ